jgi:phosphoenolpyruvate-protein phosphotransferase (PTS system enzyme I)
MKNSRKTNSANGAGDQVVPITLYGTGASPGIVIGPVLRVGDLSRQYRRRHLDAAQVGLAVQRFEQAVDEAVAELRQARRQFARQLADYVPIIDTQLLMLKDRTLYLRTIEIIRSERINAEWGLEKALAEIRIMFDSISDPYLRERFRDVEQVGERVFRLLAGNGPDPLSNGEEMVILVARDFSPADTLRMKASRVLGFLTERGGTTSHTAIVARTLGIPAVVGVENITEQVENGELVVLEGTTGRVHLHPGEDQLEQFRQQQRQYQRYSEQIASYAHLPAVTIDGLNVRVHANIEMVEEIGTALEYGAGGIGLFRSEYYYVSQQQLPDEETLFAVYRELLASVAPFPVTIRTLDIGGDKFASSISWGAEMNPALGSRAIRFSFRQPEIFRTQLRALLRASVYGNLKIMFPMISSLCEVERINETVAAVGAELDREGISRDRKVKIGIMIEVPSAVALADALARQVDFFSIGTNDLIQYTLAIDRANEYVAHMYDPLHPAVLRMIRQVVEAGHAAGIDVELCGEMAGDPVCLPLLLGLGLDELSMHPLAIPYIKRMIRNSTAEEAETLCRDILAMTGAKSIRRHLAEYLPRRYPEEFDKGVASRERFC